MLVVGAKAKLAAGARGLTATVFVTVAVPPGLVIVSVTG